MTKSNKFTNSRPQNGSPSMAQSMRGQRVTTRTADLNHRSFTPMHPGYVSDSSKNLIQPQSINPNSKDSLLNLVKPALSPVMAKYARMPLPGMGGITPQHLITAAAYINKQNPEIKDAVITGVKSAFKGEPIIKENDKTLLNSSYALSRAPHPKPVSLNTRVRANTNAIDYMPAVLGSCSPLHISCITLQVPIITANPLNSYFINTTCFDIQTRCQANVGYSVDVVNVLSASKILAAMNAAIRGLQVYYYYTSIMSYESDPRNKNEGMINLRSGITPQILSDVAQLGHRLEDTPVPPRIVEWVRYMSANWYNGDNQGSPLIKTCFDPLAIIAPPVNSFAAQALTTLVSDSNNAVFALMRRAVPKWRIGKLYDVSPIPNYDKSFRTIWSNLPSIYSAGGTTKYIYSNTDLSTAQSYNSWNNILDGLAYSMTTSNITSVGCNIPGIVDTGFVLNGTTTNDSRLSWYTDGTTKSWYSATFNDYLSRTRAETYQVTGLTGTNIVYTPHLPGTAKCQNVNGTSLIQTGENVLDYLFDVNSIPVNGSISSYNLRLIK